jgi:hypothetical protein
MRRTQWAVFTSMNPRPSAWRSMLDAAPVAGAAEPSQDQVREEIDDQARQEIREVRPFVRFE